MIRINLLPIRKLKRRIQARNQVIVYGLSLAGLAVLLLVVAMGVNGKIKSLGKKVAALQAEKSSYTSLLAEIDQLKKDKTALDSKLDIIRGLKMGSQITVRIIDELSNLTPPNRIWVQSMNLSPTLVTISGTALDNATIAKYMKAVKESPYFSDVDLTSAAMASVAGKKLKTFAMTLHIQQPKAKSSEVAMQ